MTTIHKQLDFTNTIKDDIRFSLWQVARNSASDACRAIVQRDMSRIIASIAGRQSIISDICSILASVGHNKNIKQVQHS